MRRYPKRYRAKKRGKVSDKIKKYVHRIVDAEPEKKHWPIDWPSPTVISATVGTAYPLNIMGATTGQTGVENNQRLGAKIKVKSFEFNTTLSIVGATAFGTATCVRMIVFVDKKADGLAYSAAELLYDPLAGNSFSCPLNPIYAHEFEILYERRFALNNQSGQITLANTYIPVHVKHTFKRPLTCGYYTGATATTIGSVEGPAIYVAFFSETVGSVQTQDAYSDMTFIDA